MICTKSRSGLATKTVFVDHASSGSDINRPPGSGTFTVKSTSVWFWMYWPGSAMLTVAAAASTRYEIRSYARGGGEIDELAGTTAGTKKQPVAPAQAGSAAPVAPIGTVYCNVSSVRTSNGVTKAVLNPEQLPVGLLFIEAVMETPAVITAFALTASVALALYPFSGFGEDVNVILAFEGTQDHVMEPGGQISVCPVPPTSMSKFTSAVAPGVRINTPPVSPGEDTVAVMGGEVTNGET